MKKIAILFGGCSSEYEVSLQSAYAVLKNRNGAHWEAVMVGISRSGRWYLYEGAPERIPDDQWETGEWCRPLTLCMDREQHGFLVCRDVCKTAETQSGERPVRAGEGSAWASAGTGRVSLELLQVDAAFPVLHGRNGEDGTVQGALELAGIPVIGCGTLASALCMDKELAHRVAASVGVRVPASIVFSKEEQADGMAQAKELGYPLFVKPLRAGSSLGITKVTESLALEAAVRKAFAYDDLVTVEEMIPGFEVGCAILEENGALVTGEIDEIELSEGFFDYEEKYSLKTSRIHVPARVDEETAERIKRTAHAVYRALGLSGFARVDLFLTPQGQIYFNEVNTIPGFTEHSRFPGMMRAAGIGFVELIDRLTR